MGEQWGTVVAAVIAAVAALVGVLAGVVVGRRQVTDQAAVEHGQWLRGQRQEAYVALLEAWDTGVKRFNERVQNWEGEHYHAETFEGDGWEESEKSIYIETHEIAETVQRAIERVELLGPKSVDDASAHLADALGVLRDAVRSKAGSEEWPDWEAYGEAREKADMARRGFLTASRETVRAAPRP
ncbi:hypothetical protein [Streptomyces anandii]|uniref:hypothetical protein n=1 Tax=Streptomyces anandii TaxID=285454 RepID=UPI001671A258|nr:hypothetical protein [Streptomyces anandii]GGX94631.1 hypothetical protein GCM10010510_44790 [Streptomyces anandii JCM 4720]